MNKSGWTSLVAAIGFSVLTAVTPEIQLALSHHPTVTVVMSSILAVFAHWLPSPLQK